MFEREAGSERTAGFNKAVAIAVGLLLGGGTVAVVVHGILPERRQHADWQGPGPEPSARRWAIVFEPSLRGVCQDVFQAKRDGRAIVATVAQQIGSAAPLVDAEAREALASISDRDSFIGGCLVHAYRTIEPCAVYAADAASPAARMCVSAVLERTIWAIPYELCSERVQSERLRHACALAAEQTRRHAEQTVRRTTAGL